MALPPQGFRHAVDLLLKNRMRTLPVDHEQLARDLVALGDDMKAPPAFAAWVIEEYERVVRQPAPSVLSQLGGTLPRQPERRDLFMIYVPEDRLPFAAPLAVELAKRRVSVAFNEFEVESAAELPSAIEDGLRIHRAGVLLLTPDFLRRGFSRPAAGDRLAVLDQTRPLPVQAEGLVVWLSQFHTETS